MSLARPSESVSLVVGEQTAELDGKHRKRKKRRREKQDRNESTHPDQGIDRKKRRRRSTTMGYVPTQKGESSRSGETADHEQSPHRRDRPKRRRGEGERCDDNSDNGPSPRKRRKRNSLTDAQPSAPSSTCSERTSNLPSPIAPPLPLHEHPPPRKARSDYRGDDFSGGGRDRGGGVISVLTQAEDSLDGRERFVNDTVLDPDLLERVAERITPEMRIDVACALVRANGLVSHHVDSFNRLLKEYIPQIVRERGWSHFDSKITGTRHTLEFGLVGIYKPSMREDGGDNHYVYAQECRVRNLTYACSFVCDVKHTVFSIADIAPDALEAMGPSCDGLQVLASSVAREALLFQVPCMIGSDACRLKGLPYLVDECPYDFPGRYILNGSEKVIVCQQGMRTNYPCVTADNKATSRYAYCCEVRSCHETKIRSTSTLCIKTTAGRSRAKTLAAEPPPSSKERTDPRAFVFVPQAEMMVKVPYIDKEVPIATTFRLIGVETVEEMIALVMEHNIPPGFDQERDTERTPPARDDDPELEALLRAVFTNGVPPAASHSVHSELCDSISRTDDRAQPAEKRLKYVEHILSNEFLPHVGMDRSAETLRRKAIHLAAYVHKLCAVCLGRQPVDDLDNLALKRVKTDGPLLAEILRQNFTAQVKGATAKVRKAVERGVAFSIADCINHQRATSSIKYAMATGNWGPQKGGSSAKGVAQLHRTMTVTGTLSSERHVSTSIKKNGKMTGVRQQNASHWRKLCPAETPEGQTCGTVNNLALAAHIRAGHSSDCVTSVLRRLERGDGGGVGGRLPEGAAADKLRRKSVGRPLFVDASRCEREERRAWTAVQVNGAIVGYSARSGELVRILRECRRMLVFPYDVSIVYRPLARSLAMHSDSGCYLSPIMRVDGLSKLPDIYARFASNPTRLAHELLVQGVVEWVSEDEEQTLRVALGPQDLVPGRERPGAAGGGNCAEDPYTHVEVHPILLLGVCASLIPFPERTASPRNIYQSAMQKAARSLMCLNGEHRYENMPQGLVYPQVPLVQTAMEECIGTSRLPMGQNAWVLICSYGYNQEDSVILNQQSIDMGLFRTFMRRVFREEERTRTSNPTRFEKPQRGHCRGMRSNNYGKLGPDGWVPPGTWVEPGDVLIGKTMTIEEVQADAAELARAQQLRQREMDGGGAPSSSFVTGRAARAIKRDVSLVLSGNEGGVVHSVTVTTNKDGNRAIKMVLHTMRVPEIGDKFASRYAQKGTAGMVYPPEDLPFSCVDGRQPDIVVNPHAFPSRMTIGMLVEGLMGKGGAERAMFGDGTLCGDATMEDIASDLHSLGKQRWGRERMINPRTGQMMEAMLFFVPIYYQCLKQVPIDKIHARARGAVKMLTRQPSEGRARGGGLRLGEMERDCLIAYGAAQTTRDRLFEQSDAYSSPVCEKCGMLAEPERRSSVGGAPLSMVSRRGKPYCRNCNSYDNILEVKMPYALKLLIQEIMAAHAVPRLGFSK